MLPESHYQHQTQENMAIANIVSAEVDAVCPFLNLPGELRNMIYAHALCEPASLRFWQDEYGIGRLESTTPTVILRPAATVATGKKYPTGKKEKLLRVALRAANQLQYVSHELRAETRGLGIRYNDISFDYLRDVLAFISLCPQSEAQYLRLFKINKGLYSTLGGTEGSLIGEPDDRYTQLFRFCAANPSLTIRNPLIGWRQDDPMFVPYAILVQMQFRQSSIRVGDFFTDPIIQDQVRTITSRKAGKMEEALPANFKIYPADGTFDEKLFKDTCIGDPLISTFFGRAVEGGVERWVSEARKIYEEGM